MVPRNDNLLIGLAVSLIIPVIAYYLLGQLQVMISNGAQASFAFKERTVALIAICLNVLPLNYFRKTYRNRSIRGLATGTMVLAFVWFFYYGRALLG